MLKYVFVLTGYYFASCANDGRFFYHGDMWCILDPRGMQIASNVMDQHGSLRVEFVPVTVGEHYRLYEIIASENALWWDADPRWLRSNGMTLQVLCVVWVHIMAKILRLRAKDVATNFFKARSAIGHSSISLYFLRLSIPCRCLLSETVTFDVLFFH